MATQTFTLNGTLYKSIHRSFYGGTLLVSRPVDTQPLQKQLPKPIAPPPKPVEQEILYHVQPHPRASYQSENGTIFCVILDGRTTYKSLDMKQNSKWKILLDGNIFCNACGHYKLIKNNGTFEMLQLVIS
jgi:hypothetical protein